MILNLVIQEILLIHNGKLVDSNSLLSRLLRLQQDYFVFAYLPAKLTRGLCNDINNDRILSVRPTF
jgi:hypothetical protein